MKYHTICTTHKFEQYNISVMSQQTTQPSAQPSAQSPAQRPARPNLPPLNFSGHRIPSALPPTVPLPTGPTDFFEGRLWLGSKADAERRLPEGTTHVLSIGECVETPDGIVHDEFEISDCTGANIFPIIEKCLPIIRQALANGGVVFVHCFAGISRSASIVIAYLMQENGLSFEQALKLVKERRPQVSPNLGFCGTLQAFGTSIRHPSAPPSPFPSLPMSPAYDAFYRPPPNSPVSVGSD